MEKYLVAASLFVLVLHIDLQLVSVYVVAQPVPRYKSSPKKKKPDQTRPKSSSQ